MELWRVGGHIKKQRGFNAAAKEAGIHIKSKIANCLRASPEICTVNTSTEGGEANVTVAGPSPRWQFVSPYWFTCLRRNTNWMVPRLVIACMGGGLHLVHLCVIDGSVLVMLYPL